MMPLPLLGGVFPHQSKTVEISKFQKLICETPVKFHQRGILGELSDRQTTLGVNKLFEVGCQSPIGVHANDKARSKQADDN